MHLFCPGVFCLRHRCLDGRQCVEKRKKTAARGLRKKYQRLSDRLALAARILFILCAVSFIFGFILLIGSQSSNMQPL